MWVGKLTFQPWGVGASWNPVDVIDIRKLFKNLSVKGWSIETRTNLLEAAPKIQPLAHDADCGTVSRANSRFGSSFRVPGSQASSRYPCPSQPS